MKIKLEHNIGDPFWIMLDNHPRLFLDGIHACQQVMMWREIQRLKPKKYLSFVEVAPPIGLDKEPTPE